MNKMSHLAAGWVWLLVLSGFVQFSLVSMLILILHLFFWYFLAHRLRVFVCLCDESKTCWSKIWPIYTTLDVAEYLWFSIWHRIKSGINTIWNSIVCHRCFSRISYKRSKEETKWVNLKHYTLWEQTKKKKERGSFYQYLYRDYSILYIFSSFICVLISFNFVELPLHHLHVLFTVLYKWNGCALCALHVKILIGFITWKKK